MSHIVKFHFDPQEHKLATRSLDHPPQCLHRGDGNPQREQEIGNHCELKFPGTWSINVAHANLLLDLFTLPQFDDFVFPFSFCRFNKVASHCIPQIIAILCLWFFFCGVLQPWSALTCVFSLGFRQYLLFGQPRLAALLACDCWLSLILRQIVAKLESNAHWATMQINLEWPWWQACLLSPSLSTKCPLCAGRGT